MVALHEIAGPADVAALPDEELLLLHLRLHQLDARLRATGQPREYETVNRHCWVVEEMLRRGMQHHPHDPLDEETARLCGVPSLAERLQQAVAERGTIVLVPGYVWLVGSAVEREDARDIDLLVREEPEHLTTAWRESVLLALRRVCDPEKHARRLHLVANPQGPHLVGGRPAVPLYDLALVPSRHPILRALTPLTAIEPQKPAMVGWTDFHDLDELWEAWGARTLAETPVAVSPKVDGFRVVLGRDGERVRAHLEDRDENVAERLAPVLDELPDGWLVDGELTAVHERGWLARPQLASFLAGTLEAMPVVFLFDVLVADGEDVHARPFAERWERLRALEKRVAGSTLVVLPQEEARDRGQLERAARRMAGWSWRDGGPPTEGVVVRRMDAPYVFGATDALAKVKKYVELKVEVVNVVRVANGYTYDCALRSDGGLVPLGRTFVTEERLADVGDTLNVAVEELLLEPDGSISWGKPRPLGVDRSRPAYTVEQAVDLARRFGVLKVYVAAADLGEDETNAEAAQRHWDERWHEAIPVSGRALPYVLQAHVRGLTDEEAERIRTGEWDFEDVLGTDHSLHFDLRLATDRFDGLYGITLFGGSMEENRRQLRVERIDEEPILSAPKQWQPRQWLDVAKERPFLSPPRSVGATSRRWAAFFEIDRGTYRVGFARQHAVEFVFDGEVLRGRYLWQYAALDGRRAWLFTKPREQRLYAQLHDREAVEQEVRERGQGVFFWPRDPDDLAAGLVRVDVRHKFLRSVPEKRYTLSVAYPLREADAHGDAVASLDEMERMAWEYLAHSRRIGVEHEDGTDGAGTVVESYIYRGPRWEVNGQVVEEGDWLLGVVWDEPTWERIKRGELVGLSWQGWAWRKPHRKGVRDGE